MFKKHFLGCTSKRRRGDWKINAYKQHQLIPKWGNSKANKTTRMGREVHRDECPAVESAFSFQLFQFFVCLRSGGEERRTKSSSKEDDDDNEATNIQTILMITWIINDLFIIRNQTALGQFFLSIPRPENDFLFFFFFVALLCDRRREAASDEKCGEEYFSVVFNFLARYTDQTHSHIGHWRKAKSRRSMKPENIFRRRKIFSVNRFYLKNFTKKQK